MDPRLLGKEQGACVKIQLHQESWKVRVEATTTQSEWAGILRASEFSLNQGLGAIFCDLQSILQALSPPDKDSGSNITRTCKEDLVELTILRGLKAVS